MTDVVSNFAAHVYRNAQSFKRANSNEKYEYETFVGSMYFVNTFYFSPFFIRPLLLLIF
jgi:hypothetical protein